MTERSAAAARVHNRPGSSSTDRASSSRQLGALDTPQPHESRLGVPTALTTVSADPPSPSNISSRRAPGQHPSRTPGAVSFEPDGGAPDGLSARSERTLAPPPRSPSSINHPGEHHSRTDDRRGICREHLRGRRIGASAKIAASEIRIPDVERKWPNPKLPSESMHSWPSRRAHRATSSLARAESMRRQASAARCDRWCCRSATPTDADAAATTSACRRAPCRRSAAAGA